MTATVDTPALRRLDGVGADDESWARPACRPSTPSMGYQPGLDGLRAISVIAVICYHAGFGWMHGGFFGVEVFFVVSGFLITSLLIEERERTGGSAAPVLDAPGAPVAAGTRCGARHGGDVDGRVRVATSSSPRCDATCRGRCSTSPTGARSSATCRTSRGDPPLLRHLWSLAVEEQWYLIWPFAFVLLTRRRLTPTQCAGWLVGLAVAIMTFTFWLHSGGPSLIGGPVFDGVDRTNFMYLSTFTRSTGLLLGAAAAFVWRPWRTPSRPARPGPPTRRGMRRRDRDARLHLRCGDDHRRLRVPVAAAARVGVVVGGGADGRAPGCDGSRAVFSTPPLVEIGRGATGCTSGTGRSSCSSARRTDPSAGSCSGSSVTAAASELCYQFIETPIREGALGLLVVTPGTEPMDAPRRWVECSASACWRSTRRRRSSTPPRAATTPSSCWRPTPPRRHRRRSAGGRAGRRADRTGVAAPRRDRRRLAGPRAGDQPARRHRRHVRRHRRFRRRLRGARLRARALASATGSRTRSRSARAGSEEWATPPPRRGRRGARRARRVGRVRRRDRRHHVRVRHARVRPALHHRPPIGNRRDARGGRQGRACSRWRACGPRTSTVPASRRFPSAATTPASPTSTSSCEASPAPTRTTSRSSPVPTAWCNDEAIATDLGHRWDGVHVYKPGAKLIYETIAPTLLAL